MGGDDHAGEEAPGLVVEYVPVLEGAGLALVEVADEVLAVTGSGAHHLPLAAGGEAGATASLQAAVADGSDQFGGRRG